MNPFLAMRLFCAIIGKAVAQYPAKPIRVLVPNAPGSGTDVLARLLCDKLQSLWGQSIVVETLAAASGIIAAERLAKSAPHGYTLMVRHADCRVAGRICR